MRNGVRNGAARAVLLAGFLGIAGSGAMVMWAPGASVSAAIQHETTVTSTEETTTTTEETTTTQGPVPTTEETTTTSSSPTTAPTTTAAPTTEAPPDTEPPPPEPPPPTEATTTTAPPPPPPPEDRTPPRQPGQAPTLADDPESQVITTDGADIHAAFPLLSVGGFAALGGLLGAQWYLTKPERRGRRTL